jgi:hypothetical protein
MRVYDKHIQINYFKTRGVKREITS